MKRLIYALWMSVAAFFTAATMAQSPEPAPAPFPQAQLDQILAPIALYPDSLLSQVLMAATYPRDIEDAAAWSREHSDARGQDAVRAVQDAPWDPSVVSLVAFPQVLGMLAERREWTEDLGQAFLAQQQQVMDTVQHLRARADAAGNLQSGQQILVERRGPDYVIEPAAPEVLYVPYYDPRYVYGSWWWADYPPVYWNPWPGYGYSRGLAWGYGIPIGGSFFFGSFDWPSRYLRYSSSRPWYFHGRDYRRGDRWTHDRNRSTWAGGDRRWDGNRQWGTRDGNRQLSGTRDGTRQWSGDTSRQWNGTRDGTRQWNGDTSRQWSGSRDGSRQWNGDGTRQWNGTRDGNRQQVAPASVDAARAAEAATGSAATARYPSARVAPSTVTQDGVRTAPVNRATPQYRQREATTQQPQRGNERSQGVEQRAQGLERAPGVQRAPGLERAPGLQRSPAQERSAAAQVQRAPVEVQRAPVQAQRAPTPTPVPVQRGPVQVERGVPVQRGPVQPTPAQSAPGQQQRAESAPRGRPERAERAERAEHEPPGQRGR